MKMKQHPLWITFALALLLSGVVACNSADGSYDTAEDTTPAETADHDDGDTFGEDVDEALLALKVRGAILEDLGTAVFDMDVDTDGTEVILTGAVDERSTQETAGEIAQSVEGVTAVHNHLTVEVPEEDPDTPVADTLANAELEVRDAVLETKVKSKLISEMGRHGFAIEVEATEGVVSLAGTVPEESRRELAVQTASSVNGVEKVVNLLKAS